jgi:hypothetical protein
LARQSNDPARGRLRVQQLAQHPMAARAEIAARADTMAQCGPRPGARGALVICKTTPSLTEYYAAPPLTIALEKNFATSTPTNSSSQ